MLTPEAQNLLRLIQNSDAGGSQPAANSSPLRDHDLLDAYSQAVIGVVKAVGPAVVSITSRREGSSGGMGSGFLITPDGFALTNSHVVHERDKLKATTQDGDTLDARSDLYSLGATAFFMLTGKPPFSGKNALDVLFAHRQSQVPSLGEQVPTELQQVIQRCLAKRPEERFADADQLDQALRACELASPWLVEDARRWWQEIGRG